MNNKEIIITKLFISNYNYWGYLGKGKIKKKLSDNKMCVLYWYVNLFGIHNYNLTTKIFFIFKPQYLDILFGPVP